MLWEVSTNSGATMPGKITMSDNPSTGSTSGSERAEMRAGTGSAPPDAAPKMLMNSVSGEVILRHLGIKLPPRKKDSDNYFMVAETLLRLAGGVLLDWGTSTLKNP